MNDKQIGSIEFIRIVYQGVGRTTKHGVQLLYTWIPSGKHGDHWVTGDKAQFKHCYDHLEVGKSYLVAIVLVGEHRWVWRRAWQGSPQAICNVTNITGLLGVDKFDRDQMEKIMVNAGLIQPKPIIAVDQFTAIFGIE